MSENMMQKKSSYTIIKMTFLCKIWNACNYELSSWWQNKAKQFIYFSYNHFETSSNYDMANNNQEVYKETFVKPKFASFQRTTTDDHAIELYWKSFYSLRTSS